MQIAKSFPTLIRIAHPQDKQEIVRLENLAIQNWDKTNDSDREIKVLNNLDRPNFHDEMTFVAEGDRGIVGFASFLSCRQIIRTLYVKPSLSHQEIGAKLLKAIERVAIQKRIKTLQVTPSLKDKAFYHSQGYQEIAVCHLDKMNVLLPCIAMQKKLIPIYNFNNGKTSGRQLYWHTGDRKLSFEFLARILLATIPNLFFLLLII